MKHRLLMGTALVLGLSASGAQAQTSTGSTPMAAPAANGATGIGEIIVTASRRSQSAQNLPAAVIAVSGEMLKAEGVVRPEDLSKTVAGLSLTPNGAVTQIYIRGVGTFAGISGDSSVLVSLDDVPLGLPTMVGGQFYDLARVEVLKGPQGTLYGRNAAAGAVNIVSAKPNFQGYGGEGSAEIGNYDNYRGSLAVNMPVSDTLALRASGQIVRRHGYFTDGSGDDNQESVRLQALYKPTSKLSVLIAGDYANVHGRGSPLVAVPFVDSSNPYVGPSTTLGNSYILAARASGEFPFPPGTQFQLVANDSKANARNWGIHAEVNYDLGFATFTFIPAYRSVSASQVYNPGFRLAATGDGHQTTGEARLASNPGGPLKWLVGGFYYNGHVTDTNTVQQGIGVFTGEFDTQRETRAYAAFGEATYSLLPSLRITGGLRYTNEKRTMNGFNTSIFYQAPTFTTPVTVPLTGTTSFNKLTYKAGIDYDVGPHSLAYATVSTGVRSGGINADTAPNTYAPELLTAYAIGTKNRFFGNKLQLNLEAFYWDYKNHQENVLSPLNLGGYAQITRNIGKSTLKGISADVIFRPTHLDLFSMQAEYLDATFKSFTYTLPNNVAPTQGVTTTCAVKQLTPNGPPAFPGGPPSFGTSQVDCSGKPFTRAPKWTFNLGYQHTFELANEATIEGSVHAKLASSSYLQTDYLPNERQGSYAIVDLDLGYHAKHDRWALTFYVRNVGDAVVRTSGFEHPFIPGLVYETLMPPRTYGARLDFNF